MLELSTAHFKFKARAGHGAAGEADICPALPLRTGGRGQAPPPSAAPFPLTLLHAVQVLHLSEAFLFQATCKFSLSQHGSSVTYVAADHLTRLGLTFTGRVFLLPLL